MKLEMEETDLRRIAEMVAEQLKPMLNIPANGKADVRGQDKLLDIPKLCDYLDVSERWVRGRMSKKVLPFYKMEGLVRFKKSEIDFYMKTNKAH